MTDNNFLRGCLIQSYQKCASACIDVYIYSGVQYFLISFVLCICPDESTFPSCVLQCEMCDVLCALRAGVF